MSDDKMTLKTTAAQRAIMRHDAEQGLQLTGLGDWHGVSANRMLAVLDDLDTALVLVAQQAAALAEAEPRNKDAVEVIAEYGWIDGGHHKQWVIDQAARKLLGDAYQSWVNAGDDWDTGIAP